MRAPALDPLATHHAQFAKFCYCLFNTIAMSCGLLTSLASAAITLLGPGLALRGPEGGTPQLSAREHAAIEHRGLVSRARVHW